MEKIKEIIEKRKKSIPESFVPSMKYLLITLMPAIALFHAVLAAHLEVYLAVLIFIIDFAIVYIILRIKYDTIPNVISLVFGGLILFLVIMYNVAYSFR